MVNSKKLRDLIERKGIKYSFILKQMDITYPTLKKKINNEADFTASEILELCQLLDVKNNEIMEIFLCSS